MTKLSTTAQFHATADDMLAILTDPELITRQQQQQGAVEVSVQSEPAAPNRLRQQVDMISYAQGLRGIDRSKTEPTNLTYEWDLARRAGVWHFEGPQGDKVQIDGAIRIEQLDRETTVVHSEFTINVHVPLIGSLIEKVIARQIKGGFAPFEALLREFASKGGRGRQP